MRRSTRIVARVSRLNFSSRSLSLTGSSGLCVERLIGFVLLAECAIACRSNPPRLRALVAWARRAWGDRACCEFAACAPLPTLLPHNRLGGCRHLVRCGVAVDRQIKPAKRILKHPHACPLHRLQEPTGGEGN